MPFFNYQNMSALDSSKDESGTVVDSSLLFAVSAQAIVTGTSTGTLKLQYSNDHPSIAIIAGVSTPIHWSDIPSATVAIAGAGVYSIPKTDTCYRWIQSEFVHANGEAGTITCNLEALSF